MSTQPYDAGVDAAGEVEPDTAIAVGDDVDVPDGRTDGRD